MAGYDASQLVLPDLANDSDLAVMGDAGELAEIVLASDVAPIPLSDAEIAQIIAFLTSLEDPTAITGRLGVPATVPSGLPVDQ